MSISFYVDYFGLWVIKVCLLHVTAWNEGKGDVGIKSWMIAKGHEFLSNLRWEAARQIGSRSFGFM